MDNNPGLVHDRCNHDRQQFIELRNYEEYYRCLDCNEEIMRYCECL